eukprot:SAG11_NODE_6672_length_1270_cov_1.055508_2_plen_78_part_00
MLREMIRVTKGSHLAPLYDYSTITSRAAMAIVSGINVSGINTRIALEDVRVFTSTHLPVSSRFYIELVCFHSLGCRS